jgi:ketosteroid isomerase-like protein
MAPGFANPKNSLRWAPTFAAISKSGDLGYTTGKSKRRTVEADGKVMEREGRYLTIWRKQKDGSWKVEIDHGSGGQPRPVTE